MEKLKEIVGIIYMVSLIYSFHYSLIFFIYLLDYSLIKGGCHLLPKPTVVLEEETPASSSSNTATRKKSYENINILERLEEEASDEPQEGIHSLMHELTHTVTYLLQQGIDESDTMSHSYSDVNITQGREFSISSLAAFDELMDDGIAIEYPNNDVPTGALIQTGYKVELEVIAMAWDGASTSTSIFANGKLSFVVGQEQVARGLDAAMLKLCNGAKVTIYTHLLTHSSPSLLTYSRKATIIVVPKLGYGEKGINNIVPPNSHIVYDVTVTSACNASPKEYGLPAIGPEILLGLGNYDVDDTHNQVELKVPGVILEGSITDEELALAAKAMGMK